MRFEGERCGACHAEKPLLKNPRFYAFLAYTAMLGGSLTLLVNVLKSFQ